MKFKSSPAQIILGATEQRDSHVAAAGGNR